MAPEKARGNHGGNNPTASTATSPTKTPASKKIPPPTSSPRDPLPLRTLRALRLPRKSRGSTSTATKRVDALPTQRGDRLRRAKDARRMVTVLLLVMVVLVPSHDVATGHHPPAAATAAAERDDAAHLRAAGQRGPAADRAAVREP